METLVYSQQTLRIISHTNSTLHGPESNGHPSPGHVYIKDGTQTIKKQTKPNQEIHPKQATESSFPKTIKRTD